MEVLNKGIIRFIIGVIASYLFLYFKYDYNFRSMPIIAWSFMLFTGLIYVMKEYIVTNIFKIGEFKEKLSSNKERVLREIIKWGAGLIGIAFVWSLENSGHEWQETVINYGVYGYAFILFLFLVYSYFIFENHVDIIQKSTESIKLLKTLETRYFDFKKDYLQFKYKISWQDKLYNDDFAEINTLWLILKNQYLKTEKETIDKPNTEIISSISYYPKIVKALLQYYLLDNTNAKVTLVSTMLPEFFYNFPSHITGEKELCFFRQEFVDTYRKDLEDFIIQFKKNITKKFGKETAKNRENIKKEKATFQRYTLVHNSTRDREEIFSLENIKKSMKFGIGSHPCKTPYRIDNNEYVNIDSGNKSNYQAYEVDYEDERSIYDKFCENFHISKETSYIRVLNDTDLDDLRGNYDFMLIEDGDKHICIKALLSLSNNTVSLKVIEGDDISEIKSIFGGVIDKTSKNNNSKDEGVNNKYPYKISIKDFPSAVSN